MIGQNVASKETTLGERLIQYFSKRSEYRFQGSNIFIETIVRLYLFVLATVVIVLSVASMETTFPKKAGQISLKSTGMLFPYAGKA